MRSTLTSPATAQAQVQREFAPVIVLGYRVDAYQGEATFDDTYIDALPRGNGDLATLLRAHPNVQIDEAAGSALAPGEIRPAEISINGGLYYQNLFLIDGASFTNDLDPSTYANPNSYADVPSTTQGLALDTSLLERLVVYDSNVPAAYGRFNGGVVDAVTRRAADRLSGSVSVRTTRDAWTSYPPEADDPEFALSTTADRQPSFEKYDLRARLEGRLENGLGLLGSLSVVRSTIPLRGYVNGFESTADESEKEQTRQNFNLLLKGDWTSDGGIGVQASTLYAPTDERYFIQNARDSYFDLRQGGPVVSTRLDLPLGAWQLEQRLSFSDLQSSRDSQADYFRFWNWSPEKNWGNPDRANPSSIEGAWGDIDQRQREVGWQLVVRRDPIDTAWGQHRLEFGLQVQDRYARYERLSDHTVDIRPLDTRTCTAADGTVDTVACSLSPTRRSGRGQYLSRRDIYRAGAFEVEATDYAVHAQDDIALGRFELRPGVRVEGDDYMGKTTVAPRLAMAWDVRGDGRTRLSAGLNRYFGRTFFSNALREGRESLRESYVRGANLLYRFEERGRSLNRFTELEIPYTDEGTLGVQQQLGPLALSLKWVRRDGRDEIRRQRIANDDDPAFASRVSVYTNDGRSRSDVYTLSLRPLSAWDWGVTRHEWFLAADRTDVRRNYRDYDDTFNPDADLRDVIYDGERIAFDQLPAQNFNRPWTARFGVRSEVPRWGVILGNFLRYRSGYRDVVAVGTEERDGELLDVYAERDLPEGWTLDTSLEWRRAFGATTGFVRMEANNVTNRLNPTRTGSGTIRYDPGRQYWLEVGASF